MTHPQQADMSLGQPQLCKSIKSVSLMKVLIFETHQSLCYIYILGEGARPCIPWGPTKEFNLMSTKPSEA